MRQKRALRVYFSITVQRWQSVGGQWVRALDELRRAILGDTRRVKAEVHFPVLQVSQEQEERCGLGSYARWETGVKVGQKRLLRVYCSITAGQQQEAGGRASSDTHATDAPPLSCRVFKEFAAASHPASMPSVRL